MIESPYNEGKRNFTYSSPNYISNAVFYDQTSNMSISKNEMYKTSTQRFYTPQKKSGGSHSRHYSSQVKPGKRNFSPEKLGLSYRVSPNKVKSGYHKAASASGRKVKRSSSHRGNSNSRTGSMNRKNFSNIPCLSPSIDFPGSRDQLAKEIKSTRQKLPEYYSQATSPERNLQKLPSESR